MEGFSQQTKIQIRRVTTKLKERVADYFPAVNYWDDHAWSVIFTPLFLLVFAILVWILSLSLTDPREMTDFGLISVLPITFYITIYLLTASFSLLANHLKTPGWILFLYVFVLILVIHGTPTLLYGTLRYSWAWKHVGIVDYILRHGSVNPSIAILPAYHNWPGFFALNAFITQVAGFDSALSFARWGTIFFDLLNLGAVLLIMQSLTRDRRHIWMGVWFFFVGNWVGQDYFAPQSLSYFFYLVVIGICLHWLREQRPFTLLKYVQASSPAEQAPARTRTGLVAIVILLMMVVAFSHQLTPIIIIFALSFLVIFQQIAPRSLPLLMIVFTLSWIAYGAIPFVSSSFSSLIRSFGEIEGNIAGNFISLESASPGQYVVALMSRGLTAGMGLLAFLGGVRRLRKGILDIPAVVLVISPAALLAANSYGGEILFRIYLFALPFLAFYVAALFYPSPETRTTEAVPLLAAVLSLILFIGFSFSYYGKDQQYFFTQDEVEAAEFLYNSAPPGSLLVEGARNYPSQFRNYEYFTYVPISLEPEEGRQKLVEQPVETLSRWMGNPEYSGAYFILTRSQKSQVEMLGVMPPGSFDRIEQALRASDQFTLLFSNRDASIYVLSR